MGSAAGEEHRSFAAAVEAVVAATAAGDLLTYGEVAREAGSPGAARAVGNVLRTTTRPLPWWRVVAADGRLVPGHPEEHARLLEAEGHRCADGRVLGTRPRTV